MEKQRDNTRPKSAVGVGITLVGYIALSSAAIYLVATGEVLVDIQSARRLHIYCALFGVLGAGLATTRKYYSALISETTAYSNGIPGMETHWDLGWIFYYVTRPLIGGVLGALAYMLGFVGLHVLADPESVPISLEGKYTLASVAFLAGFSASAVLDKLEQIAKQVFQSPPKN